ncbi:MAG: hypothetical protein ACXVKA_16455 [Acidimicrobiia bacterium]
MSAAFVQIDPLFEAAEIAAAFERRGAEFGVYRLYAEHEQIQLEIGLGFLPRHDAVRNFLKTRIGTEDTADSVAARTSYFREEYAYGDRLLLEGVGAMREHEALIDAARAVHGRPVIEPAIVYANLFLPGQELAVHTDVPEFRGLNRKLVPQWLLVVMHHSGLFDAWRLPIATGIAWFGAPEGGALAYWPDGPDGAVARNPARHNTAAVLDTDSVFHGVEPVGPPGAELPPLEPGSVLGTAADGRMVLQDSQGRHVRAYAWDELRFSVSWKAYCFLDVGERDTWRDHTDDLELASVLETLVDDLARRGVPDVSVSSTELGIQLIDTYIRFPAAEDARR